MHQIGARAHTHRRSWRAAYQKINAKMTSKGRNNPESLGGGGWKDHLQGYENLPRSFIVSLWYECVRIARRFPSPAPPPSSCAFYSRCKPILQNGLCGWVVLIAQSSGKSRTLREPFWASCEALHILRGEGKTRRNTGTLARAHTPSSRLRPLCTRSPPPCAPAPLHTAPRSLPAAPGRVRGSGAGLAAQTPAAASAEAGPGPWLPAAACSGSSYRPTPSSCTRRCSKEAVRARGRGPGLRHGDGSCRAAQAESQGRPPRGPPRPLAPPSLEGSARLPSQAAKGRRGARKSPRWGVRRRCRQGEGGERKTWSQGANFQRVPHSSGGGGAC